MTLFAVERLSSFHDEAEGILNIVVETPAGSQLKYDYDPDSGLFVLDRPIHSSLRYPFDYGFVPKTLARDGDPVDALIIISQPTFPGCLVRVRPVAVMDMEDESGRDEKIICVAMKDPRTRHMLDIEDVPGHCLKEIEHFFIHIKDLEKDKWARVQGFRNRAAAIDVVREGAMNAQQS